MLSVGVFDAVALLNRATAIVTGQDSLRSYRTEFNSNINMPITENISFFLIEFRY